MWALLPLLAWFGAALLVGMALYRRLPEEDRFFRILIAALPVVAADGCVRAAVFTLDATGFAWNDVRLSRAVAFWYGYKLYPGVHVGGPVVGTLHAPLTQLLYAPLGMLENPTLALILGSCLSCVLMIGPVAWLCPFCDPRARRARLFGAFVLAACVLYIEQSPSLRYSAFNLHVDAGALGFAALAAGILVRTGGSTSWTPLALSALFAIFSVWSKQTMVPLVVVLPLFVWLCDGIPRALRYAACLVSAGAAVSALMFTIFGPVPALWFNIVTMAVQMPSKDAPELSALAPYTELRADVLPAFLIAGFLLLASLCFRAGPWRDALKQQRWILFLLVALCLVPTSIAARETMGGYINHVSPVSYFVLLAAAAGVCRFFDSEASGGVLSKAALIFAVLLAAVSLDPPVDLQLAHAVRTAGANPTQQAHAFELEHPDEAYFPWNPLAVLRAEGKAYHLDYAMFDREIRGFPLTEEELHAFLPAGFHAVALPPGERPTSQALRELLVLLHPAEGPGLPGWSVWASADAGH